MITVPAFSSLNVTLPSLSVLYSVSTPFAVIVAFSTAIVTGFQLSSYDAPDNVSVISSFSETVFSVISN